jgi:hypothetical protein
MDCLELTHLRPILLQVLVVASFRKPTLPHIPYSREINKLKWLPLYKQDSHMAANNHPALRPSKIPVVNPQWAC